MTARIFRPCKSAEQSGTANSQTWLLEFSTSKKTTIEPIMGWNSSDEPMSQVKLRFKTKQEAIDYAKRVGIEFKITEPNHALQHIKSYVNLYKKKFS